MSAATACGLLAAGAKVYEHPGGQPHLPRIAAGSYALQLQGGSYSGQKVCVAEAAPIYYGSGWPHPITPTPTPSLTWTPVPSLTPTVRPALTLTPVLSGNLCGYVALRQRESIFEGTEEDWDIGLDYENQSCYVLIPGVGFDLPDAMGGHHIGWPEVRACVIWVRFPSINIVGSGWRWTFCSCPWWSICWRGSCACEAGMEPYTIRGIYMLDSAVVQVGLFLTAFLVALKIAVKLLSLLRDFIGPFPPFFVR
jgi:hypothetical protein